MASKGKKKSTWTGRSLRKLRRFLKDYQAWTKLKSELKMKKEQTKVARKGLEELATELGTYRKILILDESDLDGISLLMTEFGYTGAPHCHNNLKKSQKRKLIGTAEAMGIVLEHGSGTWS